MLFYYSLDGKNRQGPLSQEELKEKLQSGIISRETKVWHKGLSNWQRMGDILVLQDLLQIVPPPLPNSQGIKPKNKVDGPRHKQTLGLRDHEITFLKFCALPVMGILMLVAYIEFSNNFDTVGSTLGWFTGIELAAIFAGRHLTRNNILYLGFIGYFSGIFGLWAEEKMEPDNSKIQAFTFWILSILGVLWLLFFCWLELTL